MPDLRSSDRSDSHSAVQTLMQVSRNCLSPTNCEHAASRLGVVAAVNSRNAYSQFLFCTRDCCPHPACAIHSVGSLRRFCDTLASDSAVAACRLSYLGNLYGTASLAMPSDRARELLEGKAGVEPYQGGFLLHYLDKLVYPDISATVLTVAGVIICILNLAFYGRRIVGSNRS